MTSFFSFFRGIMTLVLSISSLFLPFTGGVSSAKFEAKDPDEVRLNFAAISDVHMKKDLVRYIKFGMGLSDMACSMTDIDALITAGDTTEHGEEEHFEKLYGILGRVKFTDNYIIASGNHDTWSDSGFEKSRENFVGAYNAFTGSGIDKLYYSKEVKGYTFAVLGTEENIGVEASISQTQLDWLDTTLAAATSDGKPAFVVCHQPLKDTHGLPEVWGESSVGNQSVGLKAIMKKYDNVFYITGHLHNGLNNSEDGPETYDSVESDGTLHMINLPCFMYNVSRGSKLSGSGLQFEVYDDCVVVRARNYLSSLWLSEFEYSFELQ